MGTSSRRRTRRPEYQAMLAAARRGEFGVILAEDASRLWRNSGEQAQRLDELADLGLHVVSGDLDTRHESAEIVGGIKGIMNAQFRAEIARRTRRGLEGKAHRREVHRRPRLWLHERPGPRWRDEQGRLTGKSPRHRPRARKGRGANLHVVCRRLEHATHRDRAQRARRAQSRRELATQGPDGATASGWTRPSTATSSTTRCMSATCSGVGSACRTRSATLPSASSGARSPRPRGSAVTTKRCASSRNRSWDRVRARRANLTAGNRLIRPAPV